jgi:hypothetical protein
MDKIADFKDYCVLLMAQYQDAERLKGNSLFDIFKEWCGQNYYTYEMSPNFSDYGDVDSKALNQDLKSDLERYLNK